MTKKQLWHLLEKYKCKRFTIIEYYGTIYLQVPPNKVFLIKDVFNILISNMKIDVRPLSFYQNRIRKKKFISML